MRRGLSVSSLIGDRRGTSAVEFGLVLSFFAMFVLGIMEVARYVTDQQDLYSAVHAAGRYAIVHSSTDSQSTLQTQVNNNLSILPSSAVGTTVTFSPGTPTVGGTVNITSTYTWTPLVPLVPLPTATITAVSAATILN